MNINKALTVINRFKNKTEVIKEQYKKTASIEDLTENLSILAAKHGDYAYLGDYLLDLGNEYIENGDYKAGIIFIKTVNEHFLYITDTTRLHLRMADYYAENNENEMATQHLIKLCSAVSNYEESIELHKMTELWQKLRYLVDGLVPESVNIYSATPKKSPSECSMQIGDIFALPDDDILGELSTHLNEMSGNGDWLNCLNKWERTVYYADELWMEINSGGFDSYLSYHGVNFEWAYKAFEEISAVKMLRLLDSVRNKFPQKRIPKSGDSIQNAMDTLEEKGIDFEAEDELFYSSAEEDMAVCLLNYIKENKNHFR